MRNEHILHDQYEQAKTLANDNNVLREISGTVGRKKTTNITLQAIINKTCVYLGIILYDIAI